MAVALCLSGDENVVPETHPFRPPNNHSWLCPWTTTVLSIPRNCARNPKAPNLE